LAGSLVTSIAICLAVTVAAPARAATLYLCSAYSGGTFWSAEACSTRQALVERMVNVPDGLPFNQQVRLGEQARADAERLRRPGGPAAAGAAHATGAKAGPKRPDTGKSTQAECARLDERVKKLDAQARQPHNGAAQDRITAQRAKARARQAALQC
jgi:hypothetical protein